MTAKITLIALYSSILVLITLPPAAAAAAAAPPTSASGEAIDIEMSGVLTNADACT